MKSRRLAIAFLLTLSFVTPAARASTLQQETATMTGEIHDAAGAAIPNASIIVTNVETNISFKSESNDSGIYTVTSLKPGLYNLQVEKQGFRKLIQTKITMQVNQVLRLDLTLEVGDVTAVIEITSTPQLLE